MALDIKSKGSLARSLEAMVKGEIMEGANSYFCETCNAKVAAIKRLTLKRLPNYLVLALKRIEFNYDSMTKFKINESFSFPMDLDLTSYATDQSEGVDYYRYRLRGVVVHIGYADSGHYYSFINV